MTVLRRRARRVLIGVAAVVAVGTLLGVHPEAEVVQAVAPVTWPALRSVALSAVREPEATEHAATEPRSARPESLVGARDARAESPVGARDAGTETPVGARDAGLRIQVLLTEWRAARSPAALEAALQELAAQGAPRARLFTIGEGRAGRAMFALELGAPGTPGLVVLPGTVAHEPPQGATPAAMEDLYGALDALLESVRELVLAPISSSAESTRFWARLEAQRVVFLFGARPDLLAPRLPAPGFDPTRNFPVDWDLAHRSGGGPYPLATPETRALARWLDAEAQLYAAVLLGAEPLAVGSLALGTEAADREQARLLSGPGVSATLHGAGGAALPVHGGFARHARLRAGLAVVALPADPPLDALAERLGALAELLDAVPRLELVLDPAPRAVGTDLWQVDAVLANVGGLGTANVAHARGRRPRGVSVSVASGELVVCAVRVGDGPFQVIDTQRDSEGRVVLRTVDLDAGARLSLRLFVRLAPERASERGRERPIGVRAEAPRALPARSFVTPARER